MRTRSFRAVHIEGKADDHPRRFALLHQGEQALGLLSELAFADELKRGGQGQADVGDGDTDRLFAQVEPEQSGAWGKCSFEFGNVDNGHGFGLTVAGRKVNDLALLQMCRKYWFHEKQ